MTKKYYMEYNPLSKIKNINKLYSKGLFIFDLKNDIFTIYSLGNNEFKQSNILKIDFYKNFIEEGYILEGFEYKNITYITDYAKLNNKTPYILRYINLKNKFNFINKNIQIIKPLYTYEPIDLKEYNNPVAFLSSGIYKFGTANNNKFYLRSNNG